MVLTQNALQQAEFCRNVFYVPAEAGVVLDDLLKPEFWAHVAPKLRSGDHIEVAAVDASYFAELIVVATGATWARVVVVRHTDATSAAKPVANADDFYIKWGSPTTKFRVHRKKDKEVIKDGLASAEEANAWLTAYKADNFTSES